MTQAKPSRRSTAAKQKSAKAPSRSSKTASRVGLAGKKAGAKNGKAEIEQEADGEDGAAGEREVTIDRRRTESPKPANAAASAPPLERRKKVNRRRQIDPTTCERDYTDQEVEFMNAIDDYKRKSGRMFPTCSEVLEVVRGLGYVKMPLSVTVIQDTMPAIDETAFSETAVTNL